MSYVLTDVFFNERNKCRRRENIQENHIIQELMSQELHLVVMEVLPVPTAVLGVSPTGFRLLLGFILPGSFFPGA